MLVIEASWSAGLKAFNVFRELGVKLCNRRLTMTRIAPFSTLALISALACVPAAAQNPTSKTLSFTHSETAEDMLQVATAVRAVSEAKPFADTDHKTLTLEGTPQQIAAAEWIFAQLLDPAAGPSLARREYRMEGGDNDLIEVMFMDRNVTMQQLQEVATLIRSTGEIRRLFTYNSPRAIVLRGSADQLNLAAWLFNDLNSTPEERAKLSHQYQMAAGPENVVRVFYTSQTGTVQQFQTLATKVRTATGIRRMFTYNTPRAIAARGTAEQIAQAERMLAQAN